ncbi:IgGFc-binding protein-like [Conger conger]|uniref:IgGFc-binding protein-like n=1 Tax=Conger conger TaxID=82655 RepID=UPI002A5AA18A|nr:IgGFc-binding protein-like [Conger conger]
MHFVFTVMLLYLLTFCASIHMGFAKDPCDGQNCDHNQACVVRDGQPVCLSKTRLCSAWGNWHFHTFAGRAFDFHGTCNYTFVRVPCHASSNVSVPVEVQIAWVTPAENRTEAKGEPTTNATADAFDRVLVRLQGFNIAIVKGELQQVWVNGLKYRLPYYPSGSLRLYPTGSSVVLEAGDGLLLKYDWLRRLEVRLGPELSDAACGLCGGSGRDPAHGLPALDGNGTVGEREAAVVAFARSWKTGAGGLCRDDCGDSCPRCDPARPDASSEVRACGLLQDPKGPFASCLETVDPAPYVRACKADLCTLKGDPAVACSALLAFADYCQASGIGVSPWRELANCSMACPEHSHYESCGSLCPATCADPDAPSRCQPSCAESCLCDPGFLFCGQACVPPARCGCTHQGVYRLQSEVFWADRCQQNCTCDPASRNVSCLSAHCEHDEKCVLWDGAMRCRQGALGLCLAQGDPHYTTFDGRRFDFEGDCVYLLAAHCPVVASLPDFNIEVENERTGAVESFSKMLRVQLHGYEIKVSWEVEDGVVVNGIFVSLPTVLSWGKVKIYKTGLSLYVESDFGLLLTYNWNHLVTVALPRSFSGATCGICGNFNGNRTDDLTPPTGHGVGTSEYLTRWKTGAVDGCTDVVHSDRPHCPGEMRLHLSAGEICGMLMNPDGPFGDCHESVDPADSFENCIQDVFLNNGSMPVLCRVLGAYVAACQDTGVEVHSWRSSHFCNMSCPANSQYALCSPPGQRTCTDPPSPHASVCQEGCECLPGFFLSGAECVPESECGCLHDGVYHMAGALFFPEEHCLEECTCKGRGPAVCRNATCPIGTQCGVRKATRGCYSAPGSASCTLFRGLHLHTFDGRGFDLRGTCRYVLAQMCNASEANRSAAAFSLHFQRGRLHLQIYGMNLTLAPGQRGKVEVNGVLQNLPAQLGPLRVLHRGLRVQVEADAGIVLAYDLQNFVQLAVPHGYAGRLCGLCGDFDGDPANDLRLRHGNLTSDLTALGASWKVPGLDADCVEGCGVSGCPVCNVTEAARFRTERHCGLLSAPDGPFRACQSVVDPLPHVEDCVYDLCISRGDPDQFCSSLQAYTLACHLAGAVVKTWRNETFCSLGCTANSHYSVCVDLCAVTCSNISHEVCQASRGEGCRCDPGFQLTVDRCVKPADCGCFQDGRYYELGEASWAAGCTTRCHCSSPGTLWCESAACPKGWGCGLLNGSTACVQNSVDPSICLPGAPCASNSTRTVSSCWVLGGSHFSTFDGTVFDFHGNCTYILAKRWEGSSKGSSPPPFSVLIEKSLDSFAALKTITVHLSQHHIVLKPGDASVWVNGQKKYLPVTLHEAHIHQSGLFMVMNTTIGLSLKYNRAQYVQVDLPRNSSGVCGLCGDNNGDSADDLLTPEGAVAEEVAFGWSWRLDEGDDSCAAECSDCSEEKGIQLDADAEYDVIMRIMLWSESSPFISCRLLVDPSTYGKLCARHHCVRQLDLDFLCQALQSYTTACQSAWVQIRGWRNSTFCSAQCPEHSHYELCGSACHATCGDPAPSACALPCTETCRCDEGFLYEVDGCVPAPSCGCLHQGSYHRRDQPFWADEACTETCVCEAPGGPARCSPSSCGPLASCGLRDGVRACLPHRLAYCALESGAHFHTFDGCAFLFRGSCGYRLAGLCPGVGGLAPFVVQVQNSGDAQSPLTVVVTVYNITVEISGQNNGQVKVDGLHRNMPYSLDGGRVTVHATGLRTLLQVDFGLSVTLYASERLNLALSSKYASATYGLCGNYNGDPGDDMAGRGGRQALSPSELVRRWNTGALPWCVESCGGDCPTCSPKQREEYSSPSACGGLLNATGPFRVCHGVVEPGRFYNACVSDLCREGGARSALCRSLGNYVAACQEANAKIYDWRSPGFCEQTCPQGMVYELCQISPNNTCKGSPASNAALLPPGVCYEDCICPPSLLLSGSLCVQPGNCGCVHQEEYFQVGDVLQTCRERCVCEAGGAVACNPVFCTEEEDCQVQNGLLGCYPKREYGYCSLAGRSHYHTFDGRDFHFPGTCNYTLSQCGPLNSSLDAVPFTVTLLTLLPMHAVRVEAYGLELILCPKYPDKVVVGEVLEALPFAVVNLTVYRQGHYLTVQALNSVQVTFDLRNHVVIRLPASYMNRTYGLCGNYNGFPGDDLWQPNTEAVSGKSWGSDCSDECGDNCPLCVSLLPRYTSDRHCGLITTLSGAFGACHPLVDPTGYYSNCLYDLCVSGGEQEQLCDSLQAYATACREAGVQVAPWRNDTQCMFQCPQFSHYTPCVNACSVMCAEVGHLVDCPAGCVEGCQCDPGYYFDGSGCVPPKDCSCFLDGRWYRPGEVRLLQNCTLNCACGPPVICKPHACPDSQSCAVIHGVMTCHSSDPCEGRCSPSEKCAQWAGRPVCEPSVLDLCWAWGDSHFHSFSGMDFDFDGTCSYVLAASSGGPGGLSPFAVTEKNERRHSAWASSVRSVNVRVYGHMVTMHHLEKGYVRVNGLLSRLPLSLRDRVRVEYWGQHAFLQTDFGLQVIYDWSSLVLVALHPMYRGKVFGLCAYHQGFETKGGGGGLSVVAWALLNAVSDGDRLCCTACALPAPRVTPEQEALNRKECAVLQDPTGAFALCSKTVASDPFLQGCMHDLSASDGAQEVLAQALKSYSTICQYHGFSFQNPGDLYHDDICGPHGTFAWCALPCRESCDRFISPVCNRPCLRGCVCNAGYAYINRTCALVSNCGCVDAVGQLRQLNETFWSPENCENRCTCDPSTRTAVCVRVRCPAGHRCRLLDGVRGCYPTGVVYCTLMGGLHFRTFNGHTFDFRDGYTYSLAASAAPLRAGHLVPFQISIGSASGSTRLFLSLDLRVQVYGKDLVIRKEHPHRLTVDGLYAPLPYSLNKGQILAYHSPSSITIQTDFGLQVALYRTGTITVVLPVWYSSVLQGLCGKPSDPKGMFIMRTGQVGSLQEFTDSWKTKAAGRTLTSDLKRCSKEERDVFKDFHFCQVLLDEQGPFKECNGVLDPELFYDSCLKDTCAYGGHPTAFCNSISDYATACQAANLTVREWRRDTFCGADCPANSHYELCGPSCLDTCFSSVSPASCSSLCQEGCRCDSDHVLSDGECVPHAACGCLYNGLYYPLGTFVLGDRCQEKCLCRERSKMVCFSPGCGPQESCVVEGGIGKCLPANPGTCQVLGGFGYITFDGYALAHRGTCTYVLVQSDPSALPPFKVLVSVDRVENGVDDPLKAVVLILDEDNVVEIFPRVLWKVRFNKEDFTLPMIINSGAIKAYQDGSSSVLETDFGLQIRFTSTLYVRVILPPSYSGTTSGLCGNYNGKAADDLTLRSQQVADGPSDFVKSWAEGAPGQRCTLDCTANCEPCSDVSNPEAPGVESCDFLTSTTGPFRRCCSTVAVEPYRDACVKVRCATSRKAQALCLTLEAYAVACQAKGVEVDAWRESCRLECPDQSQASRDVDSCSTTCPEILTPGLCQRHSEGCQCNGGLVFNGDACVPVSQCGCVHRGRYLKNKKLVYAPGCSKRCWCELLGGAACEPTACGPEQRCLLRDGAWGCHGDAGVCRVRPDLTFRTLDGLESNLQPNISFNLASLCDRESDRWFQVAVFQGHCKKGLVNTLHLFLYGATMVIRNGTVYVNGDLVSLPLSLPSGVSVRRIWAWPEVRVVVRKGLEAGSQPDLELEASTSGSVRVRLSSEDSGKLCGACGNYDGQACDDLPESKDWIMSLNSCGFGDSGRFGAGSVDVL